MFERFAADAGFALAVREMRTKLEAAEAPEKSFKYSPGAIYDIDFITSFLLVKHGVADKRGSLRDRLWRCVGCGVLDKSDAGVLDHAAELLRTVEHVARLVVGRAVKWLPATEHGRRVTEKLTGQILGREFPDGLESELDGTFGERAGDLREGVWRVSGRVWAGDLARALSCCQEIGESVPALRSQKVSVPLPASRARRPRHTGLSVPAQGVGGNRGGVPAALDQPDDQGDDAAEDGDGQQENQEDPAVSSDGSDISGHGGLRVAPQVPANRGQVARHLGAALDRALPPIVVTSPAIEAPDSAITLPAIAVTSPDT